METEVAHEVRRTITTTRHARHVFGAAVAICTVLAIDATCLGGTYTGPLAGAHRAFGPLLFWALTAVVYAFHLITQVNASVLDKADAVLEADRARARRQLVKIRRRLRDSNVEVKSEPGA